MYSQHVALLDRFMFIYVMVVCLMDISFLQGWKDLIFGKVFLGFLKLLLCFRCNSGHKIPTQEEHLLYIILPVTLLSVNLTKLRIKI